MHSYKKADHDTGVIAYEIDRDSITIQFKDGSLYVYTAKSAGLRAISQMKTLAKKGEGLTTYINQHVREGYQSKLR